MQIEEWISTAVSERYEEDGVVCPVQLRKGLFTVAAVDNLDYNPSSNTATSAFHGKGISLFQNVHGADQQQGENRPPVNIPPISAVAPPLPELYTAVPFTELK